jgi:GalNAc5-diNAcBac-PP-undecaprenol beta-1,3-glucosyltransferase
MRPMVTPRATVIVPTHDHGPTLRHSVGSALSQTVSDLEVVIIGDGISQEGRLVARELAEQDERVRFEDHPKGRRHGEANRRSAIEQSQAPVILYLSDDDMWFPEHVEVMLALLAEADFAHTLPAMCGPDGSMMVFTVDLSLPSARRRQVENPELNHVPLSAVGHTRELYERLPHGWRPAPEGVFTDAYMWQQILAVEDCRAASGHLPTVLCLPSPLRHGMPLGERVAELERWRPVLADPALRLEYLHAVIRTMAGPDAWRQEHLDELRAWLADREAALKWHEEHVDELRTWLADREGVIDAQQQQLAVLQSDCAALRAELEGLRQERRPV